MKKIYVLPLLLALFLTSCAQDKKAKIDDLLKIYAAQNKFNGTALVTEKGKIILEKAYGVKNVDTKIPNDNQTIYQIGSVTKTFTSTAIMLLQEQGKINVKDKLSKFFPDYPNGGKISIENLLNHTSGIPDYTHDKEFIEHGLYRHNDRSGIMALSEGKPLEFEPGSQHVYCNAGYALLGFIIEDITKMSYYEAIRKLIFEPLMMNHSGFDFTGLDSKDKATGYFNVDDDQGLDAPHVDSSASFSATGVYTTAEDLLKYATALMDHKLLKKGSFEVATKPFLNNYGCGWMEVDSFGIQMIGHTGGIRGFVSIFFMIPADHSVIILLSNTMAGDMKDIRDDIAAILYKKNYQLPEGHEAISMDDKNLKDYVGQYELTPQAIMKISFEQGKLMAHINDEHPYRIYPESKDHFFFKIFDAQIEFTRNSEDNIEQMIMHQSGSDLPGRKL